MTHKLSDLDLDPDAADDAPVNVPAGEPWTELGHARRLIRAYGERLRYVPAWKRWLCWDGKRWAHDTTGQAARWAKVIGRVAMTVRSDVECR